MGRIISEEVYDEIRFWMGMGSGIENAGIRSSYALTDKAKASSNIRVRHIRR